MKWILAALLSFCLAASGSAQTLGTGAYPFASQDNRGFDAVNVGNLNVRFSIPIVSRTGRGTNFNYYLQYEGLVWTPSTASGTATWVADANFGFNAVLNTATLTGYLTHRTINHSCPRPPHWSGAVPGSMEFTSYTYHDSLGGVHAFQFDIKGACPLSDDEDQISGDGSSADNSGYSLNTANPTQILTKTGMVISPNLFANGQNATSLTDANGNIISGNGSGSFTDTLGVNALTVSGSNPTTFTYPVTRVASGATTASAKLNYQTYTVQTQFGCSVVESGAQSVALPSSLVLADGSTYSFTYEPTYQVSGAVTGRLASVTLPTGGVISYSYTGGCSGAGINADGSVGALTRTTSDGTRTYQRSPVNSNATSTTVTDEKGNQTYYAFTIDSATGRFFETHRQAYQGNTGGNAQLLDRYTCYNGAVANCDGQGITLPISQADVTESYNSGSQVLTKNSYDPKGPLLTESDVYNGGSLLIKTQTAYNNFGEVTSTTKKTSDDRPFEYSYYGYDEGSVTSTSNLPQHTTATGTRGNLTSSHVSAGSTYISSSATYYDTGMPATSTAPDGGVTTYGYDSTQGFVSSTALPTPSSGVALSTSAVYDSGSALPLTVTGMNGDTTTVNEYDSVQRAVKTTLPSGSVISNEYPSPTFSVVHQTLAADRTSDKETTLDAYGRVSRVGVQRNYDATTAWYQVDYCYDQTGMLKFQSVPYIGSGRFDSNGNPTPKHCPGSGTSYSGTAYAYDALGRTISVTTDDGTAFTQYQNRAVKTTSVNGVQRITQYDLLGRISAVCEISQNPVGNQSPSGCKTSDSGAQPDIAGTGYSTYYSYDMFSHSAYVNQGGQVRMFQTDPAGRTVYTSEPDRGVTGYTYAYNSTGLQVTRSRPKANQSDPNVGSYTVTQYDLLSRPVTISYDDNLTKNKHFFYDSSPSFLGWSTSPANTKGRLAGDYSDSNTRRQYSYNTAGNVSVLWQCTPSICGTGNQDSRPALQFGYDLSGALTSYFDGVSGSIQYTRSIAGETTAVANGSYTDRYNTPNLLSAVTTGPFGPTSWNLGNGLATTKTYDSLGRNNGNYLCPASSNGVNCNGELYGDLATYSGSRVTSMCDTVINQCQNHYYDDFDRLVAVNSQLSFSFSYDRWGNRTGQTGSPSVSSTFDESNNHLTGSGFSYDAAGNQTADGLHSYLYDADGKVLQVDSNGSTAQYTYDTLDNRVRVQTAGSTYEYLFDTASRRISSWLMNGSATGAGNEGRIYWDGGLLANRSVNGQTFFHHTDWLGTERVRTNWQGAIASTERSRAFGDGFSQPTSSAASITVRFTNDACSSCSGQAPNQDRNLYVTAVTVNGTAQNLSQANYSGCHDGSALLCSGDLTFNASSASDIVVSAYGSPDSGIDAQMQLLVNGTLVGEWNVPAGSSQGYSVHVDPAVSQPGPYSDQDNNQFTSQERDEETGTTHFQYRQYSSTQGRWMSPDPYAGSYDFTNPQSFNRYAYVLNNPLSDFDPTGLATFRCAPEDACDGGGGGGGGWGAGWNPFVSLYASLSAFAFNASGIGEGFISASYVGPALGTTASSQVATQPSGAQSSTSPQPAPAPAPNNGMPSSGKTCTVVTLTGTATYYDLPGKTASGAPFDPNTMNAAMFQPGVVRMGDTMRVTRVNDPQNSVVVTVNDTGPFLRGPDGRAVRPLQSDPNHLIDLTPRAFIDLNGSKNAGHVPVTVTRICR